MDITIQSLKKLPDQTQAQDTVEAISGRLPGRQPSLISALDNAAKITALTAAAVAVPGVIPALFGVAIATKIANIAIAPQRAGSGVVLPRASGPETLKALEPLR